MSKISIIADSNLASTWAMILCAEGHVVDTYPHSLDHDDFIACEAPDIVILDVTNPDFGETMLIPHAKAAWPDCKIVAVVSNYTFRASAIYSMGLWTPDQLLIKPVDRRLLVATISFLWAQIRSKQIKDMVKNTRIASFPLHSEQRAALDRLAEHREEFDYEAPSIGE